MNEFLKKSVLTLTLLTAPVAQQANACGVFTSPVGGGLIAAGVCLIVFSETAGAVGALAGAGVGATLGGATGCCCGCGSEAAAGGAVLGAYIGGIGTGIASIVCGILLLEDENGQKDFKFTSLTTDSAEKLGISSEQRQEFNQNLDELNAIKESVTAELAEIIKERNLTTDDSKTAWGKVLGEVEDLGVQPKTLALILKNAGI